MNINIDPQKLDSLPIPRGDMPGDKILLEEKHFHTAQSIYRRLRDYPSITAGKRTVVSVYGGSGVGKSETASLLAYMLNMEGFKCYILSGDNYPLRVPELNDRERLRVFRSSALRELALNESINRELKDEIQHLWQDMKDLSGEEDEKTVPSWLSLYRKAGRLALSRYLGTEREIDFDYLNNLIRSFKKGETLLNLKRMGRTDEDFFYESVDFSDTRILLIEWTHGNNPALRGVDYPVFLYSSPKETLLHRRKRARDSNTDTPLIKMVLELEHERLISQMEYAALIVNKQSQVVKASEILRTGL